MDFITGDGKALHDVVVGGGGTGQAAHVVAVHQIDDAFLAAGERQRGAGNQQQSARPEVQVAIFQILPVVRREPARHGQIGAAAGEFEETFATIRHRPQVSTVPLPMTR